MSESKQEKSCDQCRFEGSDICKSCLNVTKHVKQIYNSHIERLQYPHFKQKIKDCETCEHYNKGEDICRTCSEKSLSARINFAKGGELSDQPERILVGATPRVTQILNNGLKKDQGKDRWDLVPWSAVEQVVKVLSFGAKKYGDENWKKVENLDQRYFAASMRHELQYKNSADRDDANDEESGLHHLAHKICCDLFRLENELQKKKTLDKAPANDYNSHTN